MLAALSGVVGKGEGDEVGGKAADPKIRVDKSAPPLFFFSSLCAALLLPSSPPVFYTSSLVFGPSPHHTSLYVYVRGVAS